MSLVSDVVDGGFVHVGSCFLHGLDAGRIGPFGQEAAEHACLHLLDAGEVSVAEC
jgi:hypothetical protein